MRTVYAYFLSNCHAFYSKSDRRDALDNAFFWVTFVELHFLISVSVFISKLSSVPIEAGISVSVVIGLVLHMGQKRLFSAAFRAQFMKRFQYVYRLKRPTNLAVMITPSLVIMVCLLIFLFNLD